MRTNKAVHHSQGTYNFKNFSFSDRNFPPLPVTAGVIDLKINSKLAGRRASYLCHFELFVELKKWFIKRA